MPGRISVVVPALNEARGIVGCLEAMAPLRSAPAWTERMLG